MTRQALCLLSRGVVGVFAAWPVPWRWVCHRVEHSSSLDKSGLVTASASCWSSRRTPSCRTRQCLKVCSVGSLGSGCQRLSLLSTRGAGTGVLPGLWKGTNLLRGWGLSAWSLGSKRWAEGVGCISWLVFLVPCRRDRRTVYFYCTFNKCWIFSRLFFPPPPFFLSSLLFGKVPDSLCGQWGILNVSHHQMLLFRALFSLAFNFLSDYARVRGSAAC